MRPMSCTEQMADCFDHGAMARKKAKKNLLLWLLTSLFATEHIQPSAGLTVFHNTEIKQYTGVNGEHCASVLLGVSSIT